MPKNAWEQLSECPHLAAEAPEDEMSDDELDALTSPQKSFANPFDTGTRTVARVNQPVAKLSANTKPQMSPPAPKNDFGQPVSPNQARSITKQTLARKPGESQSSAKAAPNEPSKPLVKPGYPGKFIGQAFTSNGKTEPYRSMWKDRAGDMRFGRSGERETKVSVVWDGSSWIEPAEFDMKSKSGQLKKEGDEMSDLKRVFGLQESTGKKLTFDQVKSKSPEFAKHLQKIETEDGYGVDQTPEELARWTFEERDGRLWAEAELQPGQQPQWAWFPKQKTMAEVAPDGTIYSDDLRLDNKNIKDFPA